MKEEGPYFIFPGGGTMFLEGADHYIEKLKQYITIAGGPQRTALDMGCRAVARALCYDLIAVKGNTVIWKKPCGDSCLPNQNEFGLELCDASDDPSTAWTSSINGEYAIGIIPKWPSRLTEAPSQVSVVKNEVDLFEAVTRRWARRVAFYKLSLNLKLGTLSVHNVMDTNAFFGGFVIALLSDPIWVMNVVPSREPLTFTSFMTEV